ncbi:MAG: caspase family protein [Saprospiraceae bacterium]|nr:caspase family protein [Saprospiraceae bacterium]
MKNHIIIIVLTLFVSATDAQQSNTKTQSEKGIAPLKVVSNQSSIVSNTYAVVVGISDYQDPGIPDLRFADKDAEAFANYLSSDAGGKLDVDHLKVLLNEKATVAQFAIALDWLMEVVKENDQVIIYFSGHGDVEKKTITQPGYLLCWDAPARVYLAGGALALPMFQDIITTLSAQNKAKVIVVTDACRSGKLAGSSVGGSQITGANLAKQYSNEIKILSCQPNEYSIEGEQWGGGRGAFSYHLVDALYGMADNNNDLIVNLQEAGRYIEDHVSAEVAPVSQVPMVLGNRTDVLSKVNVEILAAIKSGKSSQTMMLSAIDTKGMEEDVLSMVDTSVRMTYKLFKQALKDKVFLKPANACADSYYEQLIKEPKLERLHSTIKRNYAAALQDDAQQAINKYMKADVREISLSHKAKVVRYNDFPRQLNRAASLLGQQHYLYRTLQSRRAYFEGFPLIYGGEFTQDMLKNAAANFHEALAWNPDMPLAHLGMAWIHGYGWAQSDSAEYYIKLATQNSPTWIWPYVQLSKIYSTMIFDFLKAKEYLDLAAQIDSTSPLYWEAEGSYFFQQKRYSEAELVLKKIIESASSTICLPCSQNMLVQIYLSTERLNEAMDLAQKLVSGDSSNFSSHNMMGVVLTKMGRYKEAENEFRISVELSYNNTNPESLMYYWKAYIYQEQKEVAKAFEAFEQSIKLGYDDYTWMQVDPDIAPLRKNTEEWNALMKKYFPKEIK